MKTSITFELNKSIDVLKRTPGILTELLTGLPGEWLINNEGSKTWSPYDIVGHLIHGEKTDWIPRTKLILSENKSTFEPFDRLAQFEENRDRSINDLLTEFKLLRSQNLQYLQELDLNEEQLQLTGIHPEFGDVTIRELLSAWVVHDLSHIAQITRVMARQYKAEVGPWVKYMGVLR